MTVYKQGMMYDLKTTYDDQEAFLTIDNEWKEDAELELDEIKPWMKERKEKPITAFE